MCGHMVSSKYLTFVSKASFPKQASLPVSRNFGLHEVLPESIDVERGYFIPGSPPGNNFGGLPVSQDVSGAEAATERHRPND
jgi:hypothetical protein